MEDQWAFRRMHSQPRLPLPGQQLRVGTPEMYMHSTPELLDKRSKLMPALSSTLTLQDFTKRVSNFALQNPSDWETYILKNTRLETLNKWITKKKSLLQEDDKPPEARNLKNGMINTLAKQV